jgi:hypothetical protein
MVIIIAKMMAPYYCPTYHSDVSSVDEYSSGEENEDSANGSRGDRSLIDLPSHASDCYHNQENYDPSSRQIGSNSNFSSRPSKRANIGHATSSIMQEQLDLTVLQPSQVANVAGSSTMHAMKGGQKLIWELYDSKNEVYMNAMLREAAREGYSKTLCFPNRSKWLQAKVPIWFGSGGILGR